MFSRSKPDSYSTVKVNAILLCTIVAVVLIRTFWIADDAFMYLRTAVNFSNGYGLRFNIVERVQGYTSPLWMLILLPFHLLTTSSYLILIPLNFALMAFSFITLMKMLETSYSRIWFTLIFVYSSRVLVDYQTSGLETSLLIAVLAGFSEAVLKEKGQAKVNWWASAVMLTRFDALFFILPVVVMSSYKNYGSKGFWKHSLVPYAPLFFWAVFSLFYYGSFLPSPAVAKLNHFIPFQELIKQGLIYIIDLSIYDMLSIFILFIGLILGFICRGPSIYISLGVVLHLLYVIKIGGDFMMGRFLLGEIFLGIVLINFHLVKNLRKFTLSICGVLVIIFTNNQQCLPFAICEYKDRVGIRPNGIADERWFWAPATGLSLWTRHEGLPAAGSSDEFLDYPREFAINGHPGLAGYKNGPRVHYIDVHGLTDFFIARIPAPYDRNWRQGHFPRPSPQGYLESIQFNTNHVVNPSLHKYYDVISLMIRGPLFSWDRIATIVKFNLGSFDKFIIPDLDQYGIVRESFFRNPTSVIPWDAEGTVKIPSQGLFVELQPPSAKENLQLALDHNNQYLLKLGWCNQEKTSNNFIEQIKVPRTPSVVPGIIWIPIERTQATTAINCIYIRNTDQDPLASIGGVKREPIIEAKKSKR